MSPKCSADGRLGGRYLGRAVALGLALLLFVYHAASCQEKGNLHISYMAASRGHKRLGRRWSPAAVSRLATPGKPGKPAGVRALTRPSGEGGVCSSIWMRFAVKGKAVFEVCCWFSVGWLAHNPGLDNAEPHGRRSSTWGFFLENLVCEKGEGVVFDLPLISRTHSTAVGLTYSRDPARSPPCLPGSSSPLEI